MRNSNLEPKRTLDYSTAVISLNKNGRQHKIPCRLNQRSCGAHSGEAEKLCEAVCGLRLSIHFYDEDSIRNE